MTSQKLTRQYSGLKSFAQMAQDGEAVTRAVNAVKKIQERSTDIEMSTFSSLTSAKENRKNLPPAQENSENNIANKQTCSTSQFGEVGVMKETVCSSPVPLFPPGCVFWLLENEEMPEFMIKSDSEAWWGRLQEWGQNFSQSFTADRKVVSEDERTASTSAADAQTYSSLHQGEGHAANVQTKQKDIANLAIPSKLVENLQQKSDLGLSRDSQWLEGWIKGQLESCPGFEQQESGRSVGAKRDTHVPDIEPSMDFNQGFQDKTKHGSKNSPMLFEVDHASFDRLLLHPDMIQDHLPTTYFNAIKRMQIIMKGAL